jgi:Type II secretion system (T2SS), protein K
MSRKVRSISRKPRRHGVILVVALIITAVLAGMVFALGRTMRTELDTAGNVAASTQAHSIELAAEQYVQAMLVTGANQGESVMDVTDDQWQNIRVGEQGKGGFFYIVRPNYDDQSLPLFGLVEEGSKININSTGTGTVQLDNLFNQNTDLSDALTAWRSTTAGGDTYYQSLGANSYQCKQAPLETVEELLMVRGFTREMLYGDGTAPALGQRSNVMTSQSNSVGGDLVLSDAQISRGIYDLVTIYSKDPTLAPDGTQIVAVSDKNGLRTLLSTQLSQSRASEIMRGFPGRNAPTSIFDLYFRGGMNETELDQVANYIGPAQAAGPAAAAVVHIDVNQAPPAVLYSLVGLNGIQQTDIDNLLAARQSQVPQSGALSWVADALGNGAATRLGRYINGQSQQYSADIHAFTDNGRGFKRFRIVVDMSSGSPVVLYRRDITDRPDPMDFQVLESLKAGQGPGIASDSGAFSSGGGIR